MQVKPSQITNSYLPLVGLFLFGFLIALWYGRLGIHPIDSSIVFDGAWRIYQGQHFFEDFSTPNGFTPIGIQVLFFRLFGVNWYAYIGHSAVFNGLFAVIVYKILNLLKGKKWISLPYAAFAAVTFYPPFGSPFMEQHSFFFLLLAVLIVLSANHWEEKKANILWATLPSTILLAILSKQNPGLLAFPLAALTFFGFSPLKTWKQAGKYILFGIPLALIVFWFLVGNPFLIGAKFFDSFWTIPRVLGTDRISAWDYGFWKTIRTFLWYPFQTLSNHNFIIRHFLYFALLLVILVGILRRLKIGLNLSIPKPQKLLLAIAMILICSFFMHFTYNQAQNGLPLVFVAIGIGHIFYHNWLSNLQYGKLPKWKHSQKAVGFLSVLMLFYAGFLAYDFNASVNQKRVVLDFLPDMPFLPQNDPSQAIDCLQYDAVYYHHELQPAVFVRWMNQREGNFLLFGDLSVLYGLTNRPSVAPFLWFHPGLTLPPLETAAFEETDLRLRKRCQDLKVKYVVFENQRHLTSMKCQLECFLATESYLSDLRISTFWVGNFLIWELSS